MTSEPVEQRLAVARQLASHYGTLGKVDALFVAGSVARGLADMGSDLELDILWRESPTHAERRYAMEEIRARLEYLEPYQDNEWAERYHVGALQVDVSGFLTSTLRATIRDVTVRLNSAPERQWLLAALQDGIPILGCPLIDTLRSHLTYPDGLARKMVEEFLDMEPLWYYQRLADRNDRVMLQQVLARATTSLLTVLCALNRQYVPHPDFKWAKFILDRLPIRPKDFIPRLYEAMEKPPRESLAIYQSLALETATLVSEQWPDVLPETLRQRLDP